MKRTNKICQLMPAACLIASLAMGSSAWAGSGVANVNARQVAGTKYVEITYDLGATSTVTLAVSSNAGASFTVPASSLTGHIGANVVPGKKRRIVWNAGADWNGQYTDQMRFQVTADDTLAPTGTYMVVDLSGGPSASSYPVSYLSAVPSGGWTDEHKTTKLVLRRIPAGTFTMGSPTNELGRTTNEVQHSVTLTKDFYIGVFEVTQKQWERVMGTWRSYFTNAACRDMRPVELVSYYDIRESPGNLNDPTVHWPSNDLVNTNSFMGKLRAKTGLSTFDLPTEAQWEYACRAGTTTALNSGKDLTDTGTCPNMAEVGRYQHNHPGGFSTNSSVSTDGGTAKVGSYLPNAWGLYDMHGNVREWCLDWYVSAARGALDPLGEASGSGRVMRDGCWGSGARICRSAYRHSDTRTSGGITAASAHLGHCPNPPQKKQQRGTGVPLVFPWTRQREGKTGSGYRGLGPCRNPVI